MHPLGITGTLIYWHISGKLRMFGFYEMSTKMTIVDVAKSKRLKRYADIHFFKKV